MKKRITAIILCMAMAAGSISFTGCGNPDKGNNTNAETASSNHESVGINNQLENDLSAISEKENNTVSDPYEEQLDYIQAEYQIIDAMSLSTTADQKELGTDTQESTTNVNTENDKNLDTYANREKDSMIQALTASLFGIAGAIDVDTARKSGFFNEVNGEAVLEPVPFVGVPCTDQAGNILGEVAPIFRNVFNDGILNDFFVYEPNYELVKVDGESEKWYKFTWKAAADTVLDGIYAESYLQEVADRKNEMRKAIQEANNGSEEVTLIVSPETVAKCLDRYNCDSGYWFAFNDLEDYNADSWSYDLIYNDVRYSSTVTNADVKFSTGTDESQQTVVMEQWYSDMLVDQNADLTTNEEAFERNDKHESIAYSEERILRLKQN